MLVALDNSCYRGVYSSQRGFVSPGNDTNNDDRSALDCKLVGKEGVNR